MNMRRYWPVAIAAFTAVAVACASAPQAASQPAGEQVTQAPLVVQPTQSNGEQAQQANEPKPTDTAQPASEPTAVREPEPTKSITDSEAKPRVPTATPYSDFDAPPEGRITRGWGTDFSKHSVPYDEIFSGGVPPDGIPPIDNPQYHDVSDPPSWTKDAEPVVVVEINGDARAFPLSIMIWHEIVNDVIGGVPVSVTYCPLCNTAITFDRRIDGGALDFGTSGNLRNSDLVMYDRQTQSWWQQITGEAIVGTLTGTKLDFIPSQLVSWSDFRESFPEGKLLSRDTGNARNYNAAPYTGYDELDNVPFLFTGQFDDRLVPMERIIGLSVGDTSVAYPFGGFDNVGVVNDSIEGTEIVVFYSDGALSAFSTGSEHAEVGSSGVFDPILNGEKLTFAIKSDAIIDEGSGSTWNILGEAIDGPLAGEKLASVVHANHFWFAWAAFNPDTEVRGG